MDSYPPLQRTFNVRDFHNPPRYRGQFDKKNVGMSASSSSSVEATTSKKLVLQPSAHTFKDGPTTARKVHEATPAHFQVLLTSAQQEFSRLGSVEQNKLNQRQLELFDSLYQKIKDLIESVKDNRKDKENVRQALILIKNFLMICADDKKLYSAWELVKCIETNKLLPSKNTEYEGIIKSGIAIILNRTTKYLYRNQKADNDGTKELLSLLLSYFKENQYEPILLMQRGVQVRALCLIFKEHKYTKKPSHLMPLLRKYPYEKILQNAPREDVHKTPVFLSKTQWLTCAHRCDLKEWKKIDLVKEIERLSLSATDSMEIVALLHARADLVEIDFFCSRSEDAHQKANKLLSDLKSNKHLLGDKTYSSLLVETLKAKIGHILNQTESLHGNSSLEEVSTLLKELEKHQAIVGSQSGRIAELKLMHERLLVSGKSIQSTEDKAKITTMIQSVGSQVDTYEGLRVEVARCYEWLGQRDDALSLLNEYRGKLSKVFLYKAVLLSKMNRFKESIEVIEAQKNEVPDEERPAFLHVEGICYRMMAKEGNDNQQSSLKEKVHWSKKSLSCLKQAITEAEKNKQLGWTHGWGALGHLCDDLAKSQVLNFHQCSALLPEEMKNCTGWRDVCTRATCASKTLDPYTHAAVQQSTGKPIAPQPYKSY